MPRRLERLAPVASDLDLLAGTLGEWVAAHGSLLVAADVDGALDVGPGPGGHPRLPSLLLGDLLTLARAPMTRAALVSRQDASALRRLVPFTDVLVIGRDGREVEGAGIALAAHETPGAGWDRGGAVWWLRSRLAAALAPPIKILYLGAGPGDEAAFATLVGRAATVQVGPPAAAGTAATFRLDGAGAARRLLTALARATATVPSARGAAAS